MVLVLLAALLPQRGTRSVPLRSTAGAPAAGRPAPGSSRPASAATSTSTSTTTTTTTVPVPPTTVAPPAAVTTNCDDAIAYLLSHQAPGFSDACGRGSAFGHYGVTCWNVAGMCPDGAKFIHIACPAPFVYMNEAHNSWTIIGQSSGIDPYGQGNAAEQAFCDGFR